MTVSPRPRSRRRIARPRRGVTIVELVVAILILSIGLLSLAGTSTYVVRQMSSASLQTVAAQVAQARFDSLASVKCSLLPASGSVRGTASFRGVSEIWTVTDGNDVKSVIDTIRFRGRSRPLEYRSIIQCRD